MLGIHDKSTSLADTSVENYSIVLFSCIALKEGGWSEISAVRW
jgi:hypothetical protein